MKTYDILCASKAMSPLTHNSGSEGNETLVAQEQVVTDLGPRWIPHLSGNALRHKMVREPGARFLVDRWGLMGQVELRLLQFLFHGGALESGNPLESVQRIRTWWRLFPLVRVVGGSLPDMIVGGSLHAWRGTLVCRENETRVRQHAPTGWMGSGRLLSADRFVGRYQYVRQDAGRTVPDLAKQELMALEPESGQMIYSGQCVSAGAVFLHGFRLRAAKTCDLGCLLLSLALWSRDNGTIGGMASRGHGRIDMAAMLPDDVDGDAAIAEYVAHVDAVKDEAIDWLRSEFGKKDKPAKGKKAKAVEGNGDAG